VKRIRKGNLRNLKARSGLRPLPYTMESAREPLKLCPVCRITMRCERIEGGVTHICESCRMSIIIAPLEGARTSKETNAAEQAGPPHAASASPPFPVRQ
jgi:hypothetical protein